MRDLVGRARHQWEGCGKRVRFGVWLFAFAVLGWVSTSVWIWAVNGFNPFEAVMNFLSWGALAYGAINAILTAEQTEAADGPSCPECPHCRSA